MVKLILKNKDKTIDISNLVQKIDWSGDVRQAARTLSFNLLSSVTDMKIPTVKCELGDIVTLMQNDRILFIGYVFDKTKSSISNLIDVTCYDKGIYLKKNRTSYRFTNQTPEAITKRICTDFGIEVGNIITTGVQLTRNFLGMTLYDVIQTSYTIASEQTAKKYQIVFKGNKLNVIEKKANDTTLVIEGGTNLIDATMTNSITNLINQVAIYDENDKLIRNIKDDNLIQLYGLMQDYIKQPPDENYEKKAKKILIDNSLSQKITVNNLGNIANITGSTVVVREPYTGVYGLFFIDSDTHTWKNGLYLNKLGLNFNNIMDEKDVGSLPNKTGSKTISKEKGEQWAYIYKPEVNN